jgi:hypothetical protein
MKRYCILTLPRSGSQLCERILEDNNPNSVRLSEMFEEWYNVSYTLENHQIRKFNLENVPITFNNDKISTDWEYKLNLIHESDRNTDYTLRMFLYNHRNFYLQQKILLGLQKSNFTFVSLKRNFEDMVLSNWITKYYMDNGQNIYSMGTKISKEPILIPLEESYVHYQLSTLFTSYLCWEKRIKSLLDNVTVLHVDYENIYEDCSKILGHSVSTIEGKTIETVGYDYIINKDEMKDLIRPYIEILNHNK